MTSEEIRNSLKPFLDFAPAIIKAAEICDAAENAEKQLAAFKKDKVGLEKEISEAREALDRIAGQTKAALDERLKARAENVKDADALKQSLVPLKADYAALIKEIAATTQQKEEAVKAMKAEIAAQQEILSAIKGEISRLRSQFAAA